MWNNLIDNAKKAAESAAGKAQRAAEKLEGQINESVGAVPAKSFSSHKEDDSDQLLNENDILFEDDDFFKEDTDLDQITPTELLRNIDLKDTDRHLGEGEEVITKDRSNSKASPRGRNESFGHIREVGTESVQFNGEKSHPDLENAWEDEDDINNIYSDDLDEEESKLLIQDPGIEKKTGDGNEKDLTPTLDNSERVIITNKEKNIVDDKEEDIDPDYLKETNVMHSSHITDVSKKIKSSTGLNENSSKSPYSSIGSDSSKEQVNIAITQVDSKTVTENYVHDEELMSTGERFRADIENQEPCLSRDSKDVHTCINPIDTEKGKECKSNREISDLDNLTQEESSHEVVSENAETNKREEMESIRKDESLTNENSISIDQSSEQKSKSSLQSNKDTFTENSISSNNNENKADSFAAEKEKDSTIRKNADSSSTVPKENDPDFKTGETHNVKKEHKQIALKLNSELIDLRRQIEQRESQLSSKSEQITSMIDMFEREKDELKSKIRETRDEAKKRILKAKERVDSIQVELAEAKLRSESTGTFNVDQNRIIDELRSEGEKLAFKQSEMEINVREARSTIKNLEDSVKHETDKKKKVEDKITKMEEELKNVREKLKVAQKEETRANKLDSDLLLSRESSEKTSSVVLSLEAEVKELKISRKDMKKDMEYAIEEKKTLHDAEIAELRREKDHLLQDLELKLNMNEKEAHSREDTMRHEIGELRRRWQDSVRRADALSLDLQQSSAPLMRQLESAEKQNRVRTATWSELESRLRSELEESMIQNEILLKENKSNSINSKKVQRLLVQTEIDLETCNIEKKALNKTIVALETNLEEANMRFNRIENEHSDLSKLMKESDIKSRCELAMSINQSESQYHDKIESLEVELAREHKNRVCLQQKVEELASSTTMIVSPFHHNDRDSDLEGEKRNQKLSSKADPVDILQDTLSGLHDKNQDHNDISSQHDVVKYNKEEERDDANISSGSNSGSIVHLEQLSQGLRSAKLELSELRSQLQESEDAKKNLSTEVTEQNSEIQGLREDMSEMRLLYRTQLDTLIEEKATNTPIKSRP